MGETFERIRKGLEEAMAIAEGSKPAPRLHHNGHAFVPEAAFIALQARASDLERRLNEAVEACRGVLSWAGRRCPCHNDAPEPCPLCGARVDSTDEHGVCKAIEYTLPSKLHDALRRAAAVAEGET